MSMTVLTMFLVGRMNKLKSNSTIQNMWQKTCGKMKQVVDIFLTIAKVKYMMVLGKVRERSN
jgi:hypothetical protein